MKKTIKLSIESIKREQKVDIAKMVNLQRSQMNKKVKKAKKVNQQIFTSRHPDKI